MFHEYIEKANKETKVCLRFILSAETPKHNDIGMVQPHFSTQSKL